MPKRTVAAAATGLPELTPSRPRRRRVRPLRFDRARRQKLEALVDNVLQLLDELDGDTDLEAVNEDGGNVEDEPHDENTDDEPSLGWTATVDQTSPAWLHQPDAAWTQGVYPVLDG